MAKRESPRNFQRLWAWALLMAVSCATSACRDSAAQTPIAINVVPIANGEMTIRYDFATPQTEIRFSEIGNEYRRRHWKIQNDSIRLHSDGKGDVARSDMGAPISQLTITVRADNVRMAKNYQPLSAFGEDGVLFYTGHFWPVSNSGARRAVRFAINAPRHSALQNAEINDHPSYIYIGPILAKEMFRYRTYVDAATPDWISDEVERIAVESFSQLESLLGFSLDDKPTIFLSARINTADGRLRYDGDALPLQIHIALEGGAWRQPSSKGADILRYATIHEAVHLWQGAAPPARPDAASWIHEGGADAIAAQMMVMLGYWDEAAYAANEAQARLQCAAALRQGALATADSRKNYGAGYACGHIVALAVEAAGGGRPDQFWRAFIEYVQMGDGYTENDYLDFVEARTGRYEFGQQMRAFVRTQPANPDRAIARLLAAASIPLAPDDAH